MNVENDYLFKIGEVVKICGVTRKALLVYENEGLVVPANKDKYSGFRFYSAENITQIRSIKALQKAGLSLKEIAGYHNDPEKIDEYLKRLIYLRDELDRNITKLKIRSMKTNKMEISIINLPKTVCFSKRKICSSLPEVIAHLRETDIEAGKTGSGLKAAALFAIVSRAGQDKMDWTSCIPIDEGYAGPERLEIPEGVALCLNYRGPYEKLDEPVKVLKEYAQEHRYHLIGAFRLDFVEGPPTLGNRSEEYLTRITVFIEA